MTSNVISWREVIKRMAAKENETEPSRKENETEPSRKENETEPSIEESETEPFLNESNNTDAETDDQYLLATGSDSGRGSEAYNADFTQDPYPYPFPYPGTGQTILCQVIS
jgi:hypothetical protein